ncbi:MAG: hypothetical protein ACTHJ2_10450 [Candidatus Nitrosocosmicus sp.]
MLSITPSVYLITQYPQALAQNYNTSASVSPPNTSTMDKQSNSSITLGNPIFTEYDKTTTPPKPSVVNGTDGLQVSYIGSGVVKGVNFTANGSVFIVPRSDGFADLRGHAVMSTANGEKGTYNFYSLGRQDANGSAKDKGVLFFQTTSNGKLGIINGLVVIFKDQMDKAGNGITKGWEWK